MLIILRSSCFIYLGMFRLTNMGIDLFITMLYCHRYTRNVSMYIAIIQAKLKIKTTIEGFFVAYFKYLNIFNLNTIQN